MKHHRCQALIAKTQLQRRCVGIHARCQYGRIRQRPRRAHARFLLRQFEPARPRWRRLRWQLARAVSERLRQRQVLEEGQIAGLGKVKGRGQITTDGAAPGADIGLHHTEARFQESDDRGVVRHLRIDPAAAAPGRDHIERHARAQAIGPMQRLRRSTVQNLVVLALGAHGRCAGKARLGRVRMPLQIGRRRWRRHVVEKAVVLVEVDEEHGLAPDLRTAGQRIQHPGRVVGALRRARGVGMLRTFFGRHDP